MQVFCPLFNQARFYFVVVIELYELFVFCVSLLSIRAFANIFSHSVDCLFILCMVSSVVQKLVRVIRSHLFLFLLSWETDLQ